MIITTDNLRMLGNGFNASFMKGFSAPESQRNIIANEIASIHALENYGWMKDMPSMREWVGPRFVNNLETQEYHLKNRKWENTVAVAREKIEDDTLGMYTTIFASMGEDAAIHPDDLMFEVMVGGFGSDNGKAFDGANFFAANHVGYAPKTGKEVAYSNIQTGSAAPWFLMDLSRNYMKPFIFQMRSAVEFQQMTKSTDPEVFLHDEYRYGVRARYNAGFAWYQLAYGSKAALDATSYAAARTAMMSQYRPNGRKAGVKPTHLFYGASNEAAVLTLIEAVLVSGGNSNIWAKTITPVLCPWLD